MQKALNLLQLAKIIDNIIPSKWVGIVTRKEPRGFEKQQFEIALYSTSVIYR
jgi:hypothetical protein